MQKLTDGIDLKKNNELLKKEYFAALNDPTFKSITKKLKLSDEYLMDYTSLIEESSNEFDNCKNCKNIMNCKNKIKGFAYLPKVVNGELQFEYKPCSIKKKILKNNSYQKNIKNFDTPKLIDEASISEIYKTDKKRYKVINWLLDFVDNYEVGNKGLYLHGNFGCGKTYLVSAIFNELAKQGYKTSIVFYPEFVRQAFYNDFKDKFDIIKKVDFLLIDDIGAENLTAYNRDEILCPLLQYRMDNRLTTFITSNLNIEELKIHLASSKKGLEEVKAGRIISRVQQLTEDLELISKNLRN